MHTESVIEAGRSAFQRGDWGAAYAALTAADDDAGLPIEDLEQLATTAYLLGRRNDCVQALQRAFQANLDLVTGVCPDARRGPDPTGSFGRHCHRRVRRSAAAGQSRKDRGTRQVGTTGRAAVDR